ncbi:hypothetical protein PAXINDRAFT_14458 [Paxillus involutus ATCC 200175]|uniref:Uncharacterized protein n=1 Tax=Paxillus involutus ATCC 200175 TaxID=664439 RepID=A0A0C9TYV1_PAXIN|nr:hypothetical protein PAXINDRAFT_14458 [Paxillus involutus ATCC 200175]
MQQGEDSDNQSDNHSKKVLKKRVTGSIKQQGQDDQKKTQKRKTTSQVLCLGTTVQSMDDIY